MSAMLAYEITFAGITAYYMARTRGRARYLAALQIHEAGFARVSEALCRMRCRRAEWMDLRANQEGGIPT